MLRFRKTFVPQVDMMDCGVAALASISRYQDQLLIMRAVILRSVKEI